ncbi:MAG: Gfo/Idh/MocA family oxidoreductase [Actinomycetota bacterium]|nr:Gfo/Idh/MocA family oxidoreductase [Actinomycetota bacterium]
MSEPVRWGFLGAGNISTVALAPAVAGASGATLHAVAARDVERARALASAYDAPHAYGSYEALLADPDVDAVYVGLANDAHLPWSESALSAGKHVLCEKPLGLSAVEVDRMAAASAAGGRLLVEASWYRWHPRVSLAQRLLATGAIGAVRQVSAGFCFPGVPEGNYRLDPTKGGGAAYDIGCYAVSAVLWAYGGELPAAVAARMERGPSGVDMTADLIVSCAGGDAQVHVSMAEPERQWLVITGEEGEIELPSSPYTAWWANDTELLLSDGSGTQRLAVPAVNAYQLMVEQISSVLGGGEGWVLPLAESRATAAVLDAAFASAGAGGEPVRPD